MKASDTSDHSKAIYALASSWASIDGKLEAFGKERFAQTNEETSTGHYVGYIIEAEEVLNRLEKRGFTIVRLRNHLQRAFTKCNIHRVKKNLLHEIS